MKTTALMTVALVLGVSGMAAADCMGMGHGTGQTAESTMTPIPDQEPAKVAENPLLLLLPGEDAEENAEG